MTRSIDAALLVLFLIVTVWLMLFGSAGVILAPAAGVPRTIGLILGTLLGPLGVGWLLWKGRSSLAAIDPTGAESPGPRTSENSPPAESEFFRI